jgi:GT2 family glycosyltransferase
MHDFTSIILVTHNQLIYTKLCVQSIKRQTAEPFELVFVDNGSTDGTVEWMKELGKAVEDRGSRIEDRGVEQGSEISGQKSEGNGPVRVTVIANAENRGFPAAANQGIRAASGRQILLLNNDTMVTAGWLGRMLKALESDPQIGMVGPVSNFVGRIKGVRNLFSDSGRAAHTSL